MKIHKLFVILILVLSVVFTVTAQKKRPAAAAPKKIIFAVLNNGKSIEPVAYLSGGKLIQSASGGDEAAAMSAFHKTYYAPKKGYSLIFGGAKAGTATVMKSDPKAECSTAMAEVTVVSPKAKLGGFVMGLATDIAITKPGSGLRRKPTIDERAEIERLVTAEFAVNKVTAKPLHYHNLTALDVDNDKNADFVGSYWVAPSANQRALLFFIAQKDNAGRYELTYKEFKMTAKDEVMSGNFEDLDKSAIYHELLLDVFDYDNDGVAEIFTVTEAFESAGFAAYQWKAGAWLKVLESSDYHCGY